MIPTVLPPGFVDVHGSKAWLRVLAGTSLMDLHRRWGYELLALPSLELASSFSAGVVGLSPWPEWNPKNCFAIQVSDFDEDYQETDCRQMVLIPEGTVPVARWLGGHAKVDGFDDRLPIKIMYECGCFRNEPVASLSDRKLRQFTQFGCEVIGSSSFHADVEVLLLAAEAMGRFGLDQRNVVVRLGNVEIFNVLATRTGLSDLDTVRAKELLDGLAEQRARRTPVADRVASLLEIVEQATDNRALVDAWKWVATTAVPVEDHSDSMTEPPWEVSKNSVRKLVFVAEQLRSLGVRVVIDLAVVRSHEYYTSIVFEIDYQDERRGAFEIEVAGGGRYDRLLDAFLPSSIGPIPSTGYAFGLERLLEVAEAHGHLPETVAPIPFTSSCHLRQRQESPAEDMLWCQDAMRRDPGSWFVYLGDQKDGINRHATRVGATIVDEQ